MDTVTPMDEAIFAAGSQARLAELIGCSQQTISKLRSGKIPLDAGWAIRIERAVDGAVLAENLCPHEPWPQRLREPIYP